MAERPASEHGDIAALLDQVAARRNDTAFVARLQERLNEDAPILDQLGVPETTEDGLPLYMPVERVDTLVRCQRCGSVVEGDVVGQQQHEGWHRSVEAKIRRAWFPPRYA